MKRSPKQVYASNRNFALADCRAFQSKLLGMVSNRLIWPSELVSVSFALDELEKKLIARKTLDLAALPATSNK